MLMSITDKDSSQSLQLRKDALEIIRSDRYNNVIYLLKPLSSVVHFTSAAPRSDDWRVTMTIRTYLAKAPPIKADSPPFLALCQLYWIGFELLLR